MQNSNRIAPNVNKYYQILLRKLFSYRHSPFDFKLVRNSYFKPSFRLENFVTITERVSQSDPNGLGLWVGCKVLGLRRNP